MNATQNPGGIGLRSELARCCLPTARHDGDRNLAWVNSLCILFLLVGVVGSNPAKIRIAQPPPLEVPIPTVIEPPPPPPQRIEAQPTPDQNTSERPSTTPVVAVTLNTPAINFSIPTVGNLLVPATLAQAPPVSELVVKPIAVSRTRLVTTGQGGDRPEPPYPDIAQQMRMQGTVILYATVDANGSFTDVHVQQSSGFPLLDRTALEFVRRHWILSPGIYEIPIRYVMQSNQ